MKIDNNNNFLKYLPLKIPIVSSCFEIKIKRGEYQISKTFSAHKINKNKHVNVEWMWWKYWKRCKWIFFYRLGVSTFFLSLLISLHFLCWYNESKSRLGFVISFLLFLMEHGLISRGWLTCSTPHSHYMYKSQVDESSSSLHRSGFGSPDPLDKQRHIHISNLCYIIYIILYSCFSKVLYKFLYRPYSLLIWVHIRVC